MGHNGSSLAASHRRITRPNARVHRGVETRIVEASAQTIPFAFSLSLSRREPFYVPLQRRGPFSPSGGNHRRIALAAVVTGGVAVIGVHQTRQCQTSSESIRMELFRLFLIKQGDAAIFMVPSVVIQTPIDLMGYIQTPKYATLLAHLLVIIEKACMMGSHESGGF